MYDLKKALNSILEVKDSTIKTYERNIKRLARIAGHETVPDSKSWLVGDKGKTLLKKIEKIEYQNNS